MLFNPTLFILRRVGGPENRATEKCTAKRETMVRPIDFGPPPVAAPADFKARFHRPRISYLSFRDDIYQP